MKTKPSRHVAVEDPELYDPILLRTYCRCGALMSHPRHDMPHHPPD